MTSRIVYIRDPEKNYQFVAYAKVDLRPGSKYPYSFRLIEGPFKNTIATYERVKDE